MFEIIEFTAVGGASQKWTQINSTKEVQVKGYEALACHSGYQSHKVLMTAPTFEAAATWQFANCSY